MIKQNELAEFSPRQALTQRRQSVMPRQLTITLAKIKQSCIITESGCWEKRRVKPKRYGHFRINGLLTRAHRAAWECANGPVPPGLYVCHRCNNKRCVNPDHLYLATHRQNCIDAGRDGLLSRPTGPRGATKLNAAKETCDHGHPFSSQNTYVRQSGKRGCRECQRKLQQKYREKNRALLRRKALARHYRLAELAKPQEDSA